MSMFDGTTPEERAAMQRDTDLLAARHDTQVLRHSMEPRWQRLRGRLEDAGIALEDAAIATRNTEDHGLEFGLVVARDGRAFAFEFDFLRDEEGRDLTYEDARVSRWEELDQKRKEIYERDLVAGRKVLEEERNR